jgi:ATP-dependent Lon protease
MGFFGLGLGNRCGVYCPARNQGQGTIRFNDTAGSMAKDSVFKRGLCYTQIDREDLSNYDPCTSTWSRREDMTARRPGVAIFLAILSAIQGPPDNSKRGCDREISIQGKGAPWAACSKKSTAPVRRGSKQCWCR